MTAPTIEAEAAVEAEPFKPFIDKPGVYEISADDYHRDPVIGGSLSSTGARRLLAPSCPALFKHQLGHPPTPTDEMTFGSAVHKLVLGRGAEIDEVEADSWRTNVAKEAKRASLAAGRIPLLTKELAAAKKVAAAMLGNPVVRALLDPERGKTEQTIVWQAAETGVWCRAMLDYLPHAVSGRRLIAADVKTCPSAAPEKISRAVWDLGYFIQDAWYLEGLRVLGVGEQPAMAFIFAEKSAPYLTNVVQLNHLALEAGAHYARQARLIYAECVANDSWPGYSSEIELIELPPWAQTVYFRETGK